MIKTVGRIVARGDGIAGLFIPMGKGTPDGIYEIRECMGELTVHRIGKPAMHRGRFTGLDVEGLLNERPNCVMTNEEPDRVRETEKVRGHA